MKTAVQQIMIGTITNNRKKAMETLTEIKNTGYTGIELNAFMIHKTPFIVRMLMNLAGMPAGRGGKLNWHELVKNSGLKIIAIHYDLGTLETKISDVIDELKRFETQYAVITGMYRFDYTSENKLETFCERMNAAGRVLADHNISLLYHNHNVEWKKLKNGKNAYEYLIEHTNPDYVNFEFDSYWPTEAGVNAFAVMQKLGRRMKLYHINDRGNRDQGPFLTPIMRSSSMELGTGVMDLDSFITQAKECGADAIILETHSNFIDKSPMKSLKISYDFLKSRI